jgi:hypothetical protein
LTPPRSYADASNKADFIAHMAKLDFDLASDLVQNREGTEINLFFANRGKGMRAEGARVPQEPRRGGWDGVF